MRASTLLTAAALAATAMLAGCSGNDNPAAQPPVVDAGTTSTLAEQSRNRSDADAPLAVNGGAFAFDDTSETADPIAINR